MDYPHHALNAGDRHLKALKKIRNIKYAAFHSALFLNGVFYATQLG